MSVAKPEPTLQEAVRTAVKDVENALLENILASQAVTEAELRKKSARFTLLKAKERLSSLSMEYM